MCGTSEKRPVEAADLWHLWHLRFFDVWGFAKKTKKIHTVWQKPRNVTKLKIVTLWHLEISQNVTLFQILVQSYVYLLCLDWARNGSYSLVLSTDCARSYNSFIHKRTTVDAIRVTENVLFERFYLVLGLGTFGLWVKCPHAPTTPIV